MLFDDVAVSDPIKYYEATGTRVALRKASAASYLFGDHLGSTSLVAEASGGKVARQSYYPFGTPRTPNSSTLPTDYLSPASAARLRRAPN